MAIQSTAILQLWAVPVSGILLGLNAPGFNTQWVGLVALVPLLLMLDHWFSDPRRSVGRRLLYSFAACWMIAGIGSSIGAYWITHSAHVFGHLPWFGALAVTFFGYGLEVGLLLWVSLAWPLVLIRPHSGWDLPVRILWFVLIDASAPRLIGWNFGGLTFSGFPLLEQSADLVGSSGLSLYGLGCNILLLGWWHWKTGRRISFRLLSYLSTLLAVLFIGGMFYGMLKLPILMQEQSLKKQPRLWVGAVQPNFSLGHLASNPDMAHSQRELNLDQLLLDSEKALMRYPAQTGLPRLIIWPESVYPDPFFKTASSRELVLSWARRHQTSILLASVDWELGPDGPRFFGISVLIGPNGRILGRYDKIFLIPFGETLPLSDWFPKTAQWVRSKIRNMSEFSAGADYTVFSLPSGLNLSASICFDIFSPEIVRNMTRNGAGLVANLSNLAWFGPTSATYSMEAFARWRAIENRVPVLFVSNNGSSIFIGADGQSLSPGLGLFKAGNLAETITLGSHYSFYRENRENVLLLLMLILILVSVLAQCQGRILGNWKARDSSQ